VVLEAVVVGALLGAAGVEVAGFEGVCALAARVAAATVRARRKRFMAERISNLIPTGSVSGEPWYGATGIGYESGSLQMQVHI
jgi:hypothetical protein